MKRKLLAAACLLLVISACNEISNHEAKRKSSAIDKTVGERIPTDLANRWIDAYHKQNSAGRKQGLQCTITSQNFDEIFSSMPLLGLAFHYAIDESGVGHILILTVSEDKRLWSADGSRVCLDASTDSIIEESTARAWTQKFKNEHPAGVWYHFFGWNILDEMRREPSFAEFDIVPALNDEGLPQLLLVINSNMSANGGRLMEESIVIDKGTLCPPCTGDE